MSPSQLDSILALAVGFALAGFVSALYSALRARPASFSLLMAGGPGLVATIPLLAVTGPAIIMRNTLRGRKFERRPIHFVTLATIIASFWAIALGYQVMKAFSGFAG
ncbi:MAG TPA: hypothetical protein PKW21_11465 [Rhabdaerophilum sp.]|nr:hypothetical protein [Rhabdaerophilum sp.]